MQRGKTMVKKRDLRARIEQALSDTHGGLELGDILENAGRKDVAIIKEYLPDLLSHPDWTVRVDALELIGRFHLRQFLDMVRARLQDRNHVVTDYALTASYDLLGRKALALIDEARASADLSHRVTALVLHYIETRDRGTLDELRRILIRKRCRFTHRYAAMSTFDAYVDVGRYPEVIGIFEEIRSALVELPRKYGLDKDLPRMLDKWKRSERQKRR